MNAAAGDPDEHGKVEEPARQLVGQEPRKPRAVEEKPQRQPRQVDRRKTGEINGEEAEVADQRAPPFPEQRDRAEEDVQSGAGDSHLKEAPVEAKGVDSERDGRGS